MISSARSALIQNLETCASRSSGRMKLLTVQFRSLGDAALSLAAIGAIRRRFPDCELHSLVPDVAAPLLENHPDVNRVWAFPRNRGKANLVQSWSVLRALRAERFDLSIDLVGNDRGALISLICGARQRWGAFAAGGFLGRRFCYHRRLAQATSDRHETIRMLSMLKPLGIVPPDSEADLDVRLFVKQQARENVLENIRRPVVICHIGAGLPKKEWPIQRWAEFHQLAGSRGLQVVFSSGVSEREQRAAEKLRELIPNARFLPNLKLPQFLAALTSADAVVSNDTGPMHFAAALGVKTIGIFGPTSLTRWRPIGRNVQTVQTDGCTCGGASHACHSRRHCLSTITAQMVVDRLTTLQDKP